MSEVLKKTEFEILKLLPLLVPTFFLHCNKEKTEQKDIFLND
jgi:hypothetical protein